MRKKRTREGGWIGKWKTDGKLVETREGGRGINSRNRNRRQEREDGGKKSTQHLHPPDVFAASLLSLAIYSNILHLSPVLLASFLSYPKSSPRKSVHHLP